MYLKIFQKYLFKEALKVFLFFLIGFYFLYVLIDYSVHAKKFSFAKFAFSDFFLYYLGQFTKRASVLIPFALMLATAKVLTSLNQKKELVALQVGGISKKQILRPFLLFASLCSLLLYLNFQFFLPNSENYLKDIEMRFSQVKQEEMIPTLSSLQLKDGSIFVYQSFNPNTKIFFDAFWLQDKDHILRIKFLNISEKLPKGQFVDILERNSREQFRKTHSYDELELSTFSLEEKVDTDIKKYAQSEPLTSLFHEIFYREVTLDEHADFFASFTYKILSPFLTFVVVLILAPYCMHYGRSIPFFLIYSLAIFGFVILSTLIDAAFILAENQILHPIITLVVPFVIFFAIACYHYCFLVKT